MLKSSERLEASHVNLSHDIVSIGNAADLRTKDDEDLVRRILEEFMPWKKGPFSIFGNMIDSEWRSDLKWTRILPHLDLKGKSVADIGCNNGYFMFRMAALEPRLVVGFEPVVKHWLTFNWLNQFVRADNLSFEPVGVEYFADYPENFDNIFCMGILYHHTDPVGILRAILAKLAKGGKAVIDCQCIPGDEPVALVPRRKYAGATGIWSLPTQSALEHWLLRAGFGKLTWIFNEKLSVDEQRRTKWAPIESLAEFLKPDNNELTVEGYPAPRRIYVIAER
jgi:tRNA (mo5U34)-methyltransferase